MSLTTVSNSSTNTLDYTSKFSVVLTLTMEDGTTKTLEVKEGDLVTDLVFKDGTEYKSITGRVRVINFKTKAGTTGKEVCYHESVSKFNDYFTPTSFNIDYSEEYDGKVIIVPISAIRDFDDHSTTSVDATTGVGIYAPPGVVPEDSVLIVSTEFTDEENTTINEVFKYDDQDYVVYNLTIESDGVEIQPDGSVTVSVPVPEGFDEDRISVYYIDDEGTYQELVYTIEDGMISFSTGHFSMYAIVCDKVLEHKFVRAENEAGIVYNITNGGDVYIELGNASGIARTDEDELEIYSTYSLRPGKINENCRSVHYTITGGSASNIFGGSWSDNESLAPEDYVETEKSEFDITGGTIYSIVGGGYKRARVHDSVINVAGDAKLDFLMGGGMSSGKDYATSTKGTDSGTADNPIGSIVEEATVNVGGDAVVNWCFGGGQGYSTVEKTTINISDNASICELVGSGSNGYTGDIVMNVTGGTIYSDLFSVNRGFVNNVTMNIFGGRIGTTVEECDAVFGSGNACGMGLYLGAAPESSNTTGKLIDGTINLNIHGGTFAGIYFGQGLDNTKEINLNGSVPYVIKAQTTCGVNEKLPPVGYTVPVDQVITVGPNVTLEIPEGLTVTNNGHIINAGGTIDVKGTLAGNAIETAE